MTPAIRPAVTADAEAVLSLARLLAATFSLDEDAFRRSYSALLGADGASLLVAESGSRIVGYLLGFEHDTFFANGRVAWVEEVMVEAPSRRQGVGESLIREFETWARSRNCRLVGLATRRAAAFYDAIGYEESAAYFRKIL